MLTKEQDEFKKNYWLWTLLVQTYLIISRSRDKIINRKLFPRAQGAAINYLANNPDGVTIESLADYLFISRNSVSELITRMESRGLVKRFKDVGKNHRIKIILTKEGAEAYQNATRPEFICEIMSGLTDKQREQLQSALEIIREKALETYSIKVPLPSLKNNEH